jgi:hypothetical protein
VRQANASGSETGRATPSGGLQAQPPAQDAAFTPATLAGSSGTWQPRHAHDLFAVPSWSPGAPTHPRPSPIVPARFGVRASPPIRTFPLLI